MISVITQEIYVQPVLSSMFTNFELMTRFLFLSLEFLIFWMTLLSNLLFLAIRMLSPNQVNIVQIRKEKQMPSIDTIESVSVLLQQYNCFIVPSLSCAYSLYLLKKMGIESLGALALFTYM